MFFVRALGWDDAWDKDLDDFSDAEKLSILSTKSGKEFGVLQDMIIEDSRFTVNSRGFSSSQEFQLYCPDCLDEGTPYFRKTWRSALIVSCDKHGTFLQSRCNSCFSPVRLLGRKHRFRIECCGDCGVPLSRDANRIVVPTYLVEFTQKIVLTFGGSWFSLGSTHVHPTLFLESFPIFAEMFCRNEVWVKLYDRLRLGTYVGRPSLMYFHRRESFTDRCVLMLVVSWVLADWPRRFRLAMKDVSPNVFGYLAKNEALPFWLSSLIKECFDIPGEHLNADEFMHMTRMISTGRLDENKYYKAFGRNHCLRINGRFLNNFNNIREEAIKLHAGS